MNNLKLLSITFLFFMGLARGSYASDPGTLEDAVGEAPETADGNTNASVPTTGANSGGSKRRTAETDDNPGAKKRAHHDSPQETISELTRLIKHNPEQISQNPNLQMIFVDNIDKIDDELDDELLLSNSLDKVIPDLEQRALTDSKLAYILIRYGNTPLQENVVQNVCQNAQGNDMLAQFSLGWMYHIGWTQADGTQYPSDKAQAMKWFTKAAEQGHKDAPYFVALYYEDGWMGHDGTQYPPDPDQAMKWFTKAAERGDALSQHRLVSYYIDSWTRPDDTQQAPDPEKALKWSLKWLCKPAAQKQKLNLLTRLIDVRPVPHSDQVNPTSELTIDTTEQEAILMRYAGHFSSTTSMTDTISRPIYHKLFNDAHENLLLLKEPVYCFGKPGFLVTCVTPKFDIFGERENPFILPFNIEGRPYLCFGERNIRAANQLQIVLSKLQDEGTLEALIASLKSDDDIDFEASALEELKQVKVRVKDVADLVSKELHQNVASRNKRFIGYYGLEETAPSEESR